MNRSQPEKTVILGPEYDERLQRAVVDVLLRLGASPQGHEWGVAGSVELQTVEITIGTDRLVLEAETYIGFSLRGPSTIVDRIEAMVKAEMAKPQN